MSRIFRGGVGVAVEPAYWRETGERARPGVQSFAPRRLDAQGKPVTDPAPAPPPKPQQKAPAAPPPPPAPPPPNLDAIRKQAFQEGYQAGEQAAADQAETEFGKKLASLTGVVSSLAHYKQQLRGDVHREVVDLAFAIARRILRREAHLDPKMTLAMVRACLDEYPGIEVKEVRVNPAEVELIREHFGRELKISADPAVQPGGAVLDTPQGRLDAQLETQLEELERGLADA